MARKAAAALAAALLVLLACCSSGARGSEAPEAVWASLVGFLTALAGDDPQAALRLGWNASVDPCGAGRGAGDVSAWGATVRCFENASENAGAVKRILLDGKGLSGTIDPSLLCAAPVVRVVNLTGNSLRGGVPAAISACAGLTHLELAGNRLSGGLPPSLAELARLQVLDVSRNNLSGEIPPGLGRLGKLVRFLANDNHFNGTIPGFNLTGFQSFSVSNNNLTGPIPENTPSRFGNESFLPNASGMCGRPLFQPCKSSPSLPPPPAPVVSPTSTSDSDSDAQGGNGKSNKKRRTVRRIVMYLGYILLGAAILAFVLYKLCSRNKKGKLGTRNSKLGVTRRSAYDSSRPTTTTTSVSPSKSAYSLQTSAERTPAAAAAAAGGAPSASLVVLRRSGTASITSKAAAAAAKELRFEDLLKSPAELLGRGRFGSSYKVAVPGGAALAVKRVKDEAVGEEEFRRRMERVGRAKHPAVLPPLAFYCAMQEKLVVYEFQSNGSLARLLHGSIESSQGPVDWPARLHIAARIADGMAFMHTTLRGNGIGSSSSSNTPSPVVAEAAAAADGPIAHGNLKASNILFTDGMDPCISEYGVTAPGRADGGGGGAAALRADVRAFGVLLLELLTGKATSAQGDGAELARWVSAVIREEWTAEVFDRALLAGASGDGSTEQRIVRLLQIAMQCADASPGAAAPPSMQEVARMVNAIREEDDRSVSSEA